MAYNTHAKGENARVGTHARGEYDHGLTMGVRKLAVAAANQARREGEGGWITYGVCVVDVLRKCLTQLFATLSLTLCSGIDSNCIQKNVQGPVGSPPTLHCTYTRSYTRHTDGEKGGVEGDDGSGLSN
jgi:hypothetical protein